MKNFKRQLIAVLIFLSISSLIGCQNAVNEKIEQINIDATSLANPIREALLKNKKLILSIGSGLCENCKIVEETLNEYKKEKPDDIEVLIFTDYTDIKTFQILNITISPTTLLIDENHVVKKRIIGPFSIDELKKYLEEVW